MEEQDSELHLPPIDDRRLHAINRSHNLTSILDKKWNSQANQDNHRAFDSKTSSRMINAVALEKNINVRRHTDFITVDRLRKTSVKRPSFNEFYKLDMDSLKKEFKGTLGEELVVDRMPSFAHELREELRRRDFEEYIILQSANSVEVGHLYFKIVKLFHYITVTNIEGTLIALLSLVRLVKRCQEVVQAVEESDGIVVLLNLLESKVISVQLASMKLLTSLFQVIYLRRMAIAYGVVQILVTLLLEPDDDVKGTAADLLASLALLKEARTLIPKTKGIQHLVCILNMTKLSTDGERKSIDIDQPTVNRRRSLTIEENFRAQEDATRNDRVLTSVATALWRFSQSSINRKIMQRAGLMLTLTKLIQTKNVKLLVPILGIIQGCAEDVAFRISVRTEGLLKYLIEYLNTTDPRVKLQCSRALFICMDDDLTKHTMHSLGALQALSATLSQQVTQAEKMLHTGWLDSYSEFNSMTRRPYRDDMINNNAEETNTVATHTVLTEGNVRLGRLRMSNQPGAQTRSGLSDSGTPTQKPLDVVCFHLLQTILATIWKCALVETNLPLLHDEGVTYCVIKLLDMLPSHLNTYQQPACAVSPRLRKVTVLEHVCAVNLQCLSLLAQLGVVQRELISRTSTLKSLIQLLSHASTDILVPAINAIAPMASNVELMQLLNEHEGFRFLFSLCFHSDTQVGKAALWAVQSFLKGAPNRAALLRPVSSSLGYLVHTLYKEYQKLLNLYKKPAVEQEQLLSAICSVLAELAFTETGRTILTELGVVPFLINLVTVAREECLRIGVSAAIAQFACNPHLIKLFREKELLRCLIEFVRKGSPELRYNAVQALDILSEDQVICSIIKSMDITSVFLQMMCGHENEVQSAAAHVIGRMAKLNFGPRRRAAGVNKAHKSRS